jgi:hypothetical protein
VTGHLHVGRGRNPAQRWCIWHTASGQIVLRGYRGKATALRDLPHIETLTDWSRPVDELLSDRATRERMSAEQIRILNSTPALKATLSRHLANSRETTTATSLSWAGRPRGTHRGRIRGSTTGRSCTVLAELAQQPGECPALAVQLGRGLVHHHRDGIPRLEVFDNGGQPAA